MLNLKTFVKSPVFKVAMVYLGFTLFCVLFASVYMIFAHGVSSNYMTFLFAWPLCGGVITTLGVLIARGKPIRLAFNIFNSGIAILTAGSMFRGILDIAHATSPYEIAFWIIGWLVTIIGFAIYLVIVLLKEVPQFDNHNDSKK